MHEASEFQLGQKGEHARNSRRSMDSQLLCRFGHILGTNENAAVERDGYNLGPTGSLSNARTPKTHS
jgi:hypothetical protein